MKKTTTAIVGMSLGNSYFNEENIRWVLEKAHERFTGLKVMIPDHPMRYTYRALGENKIDSKIVARANAIRNKVMHVTGMPKDMVIDWKSQINTHPAYKRSVKELLRLSQTNQSFRLALESTTRDVLAGNTPLESDKVKTGTKFLICELAFLIAAKEILGGEVTYIYHRPWPIFTDLIAGKFDGEKRDIDFEIIEKGA